jgi:hypothetical protein
VTNRNGTNVRTSGERAAIALRAVVDAVFGDRVAD